MDALVMPVKCRSYQTVMIIQLNMGPKEWLIAVKVVWLMVVESAQYASYPCIDGISTK